VRAVLTPREGSEAAIEASRAASAVPAPSLKLSPALGSARPASSAVGDKR